MCCLTNAEAEKCIDEVFTVAGVQRVISVDDAYFDEFPPEEAVALSEQLDNNALAKALAPHLTAPPPNDPDIRRNVVRELWATLDGEARRQAMRRLVGQQAANVGSPPSAADGLDDLTASLLPTLFKKYHPRFLSLSKWRTAQEALLASPIPITLILVDEDFSKEGGGTEEGLRIIKEVLKTPNTDAVLCALLSHKYRREGIHEQWDQLCRKEEIDKSRFVLIPKSFLSEDLIGFARLLKLAILNGPVQSLKAKTLDILRGAIDHSAIRLASIDIYDFDQIVFRSSLREGVWEPDTLFRVFGLFHHDETRKVAKADVGLHELADRIRTISQISTDSSSAPNYNTIQLQSLELYEDPEYLNSHFTPIQVGDIFEVSKGEEKKRFILLAQPCDLMVRSDGNRHHAVVESVLGEIVSGEHRNHEGFAELPFFENNAATKNYVALRKVVAVSLLPLDFCAYRETGESTFALTDVCPKTVIPAWRARHEILINDVRKILTKVDEMTKAGSNAVDAIQIVARCSNHRWLIPHVDLAKRSLSYGLKRVGRLREPRAAAILSRYANFLSRYAFEHDLGEREQTSQVEAAVPISTMNQSAPEEVSVTNADPPAAGAPQSESR